MPILSFFRKRRAHHHHQGDEDPALNPGGSPRDPTTDNYDEPHAATWPLRAPTSPPMTPPPPGHVTGEGEQALTAAPAPTVASGPEDKTRRFSSKRDPFRRFRSRSTQFRPGGAGEAPERTRNTRLSWPARMPAPWSPDSTSSSLRPDSAQALQLPRQRGPGREHPSVGTVDGRDGLEAAARAPPRAAEDGFTFDARDVALAMRLGRQRDRGSAPPPARPGRGDDDDQHSQSPGAATEKRRRPNSSIETSARTSPSGVTNKGDSTLQRLKRLPSISLRRGFSRRMLDWKTEPAPAIRVTQAPTMISDSSQPNSALESPSPHSTQGTQSPSHHNKPLPPTPPQDGYHADSVTDTTTAAADGTIPRANLLRLNRIMATLSSLDIEKLFSGAPQYFARSEGHFTGAPHPSVAFPWDESLAIRDLTDHVQIEDEAWGSITAWPHITRDVRRGPSASATRKVAERRRAHFYPRCRERPNMLSMQGLEKGTMGYQAALELGVADALQDEQWGFGSVGAKDRVIVDARKNLIASKDGLRRLDETMVLDHLIKNSQRYREKHSKDRATCHDLSKELFAQILHPPHRTFTDPSNLSVQIQALVKALAQPNVWIDFSHVEWRIRLGQVLWGTADDDGEDSVSDGASITDAEDTKGLHEERYWLLLHILLACELLIRLDTITEGDEIPGSVRPSEIHRFERDANVSVRWSLHLARVWLENIEITKTKQSTDGEHELPKGWLANLTQRMTLASDRPHSRHHERHHTGTREHFIYVMRGRHWERQVRGLTHFARRLKWPEIETQSTLISDNCRAVTEGTPLNTPFETPMSRFTAKSHDSSYFAISKENAARRKQPRRQKVGAALHPAGWLSKSYVSGLMLPGEGLYHFIMSTLLETDISAISRLGPMANLCGGFVYSDKSFWSTACVVGRVLAAGKGAVECMGWISSDVVPPALHDGWVNIDVEDIPEDVRKTGKQARIWGKLAIERESSVLGGSDPSSVFPADFIIPYESHYATPPPTISVQMMSLDLTAPLDSVQTTPTLEVVTPFSDTSAVPEIKTYTPSIKFNVTTWEDDEDREYAFTVAKDVYFVTAHPCVPSHHVRILKSPSSPTIQQIDLTGHQILGHGRGRSTGHATIACHPLHKYYTYTSVHLSELLEKASWPLQDLLLDASTDTSPSITPSSNSARTPRVLVIDAMTNFVPLPEAHDIPLSPVTSRTSTTLSEASVSSNTPPSRQSSLSGPADSPDADGGGGFPARLKRTDTDKNGGAAEQQMHSETRRRQFGSDNEILVRAICAEKGWNALISRRRRGCLACAIREAGALGWRVVIRVD